MLNPSTAQTVIDHGVSLGADFAELFIERSQNSVISTLSQQVQSVESGIDFGIGVRLVYGTKVLYGYTNKTDSEELQRIMCELAAKDLRDPRASSQSFDYRSPVEHHPASRILSTDAEVDSKVAYLLKADTAARAASNLISQTRGNCRQKEQRVEIFNSEGLHTSDLRTTSAPHSHPSPRTVLNRPPVCGVMVVCLAGKSAKRLTRKKPARKPQDRRW